MVATVLSCNVICKLRPVVQGLSKNPAFVAWAASRERVGNLPGVQDRIWAWSNWLVLAAGPGHCANAAPALLRALILTSTV